MKYESEQWFKELPNELKELLTNINRRLDEYGSKIDDITQKMDKIMKRDQTNVSSPPFKKQFGGTINVPCHKCKKEHTVPYIPGHYEPCVWMGVDVSREGEVKTKFSY